MDYEFKILRQSRALLGKLYSGFSEEQLTTIPEGFNNHLLWHFGHVVVTQQLLCYKLAGVPMHVTDAQVNMFRKGTSPREWDHLPERDFIDRQLTSLVDVMENDYKNGLFKEHEIYPTSFGITLTSIEDAIRFNNIHDGMHIGYILAIRKHV